MTEPLRELNVLPEPKVIELAEGQFNLNELEAPYVCCTEKPEAVETGRMLAEELGRICGRQVDLRVSPSAGYPLALSLCKPLEGVGELESAARSEGYRIDAAPDGMLAAGWDAAGLFYATRTLVQLLEDGRPAPAGTILDWPDLALRGFHWDLKGWCPRLPDLKRTVDEMARFKLNCVLVEWEDKLELESMPGVPLPFALSKEDAAQLIEYARARHIDVVPLLQCLGHAEYVLQHERYAHLRERREGEGSVGHAAAISQYCPSNPESSRFILSVISEMTELHPSEMFHIGSDETWQLGECPECSRRAAEAGKLSLFLDHTVPLCEFLVEKGRAPMLWDDMLRQCDDDAMRALPAETILVYWQYRPIPEFRCFEKYAKAGLGVVGASAVKGADGVWANLPRYENRFSNVDSWARAAESHELGGVIATAWARYNSLTPQCEPFETSWYSLCYSAERCWAGQAVDMEGFDRKFASRFYGLDPSCTEAAAAQREPRRAELFRQTEGKVKLNRDHFHAMELIGRVDAHVARRGELINWLSHVAPRLHVLGLPDEMLSARDRGFLAVARESRLASEAAEIASAFRTFFENVYYEPEIADYLATRLEATGHVAELAARMLQP